MTLADLTKIATLLNRARDKGLPLDIAETRKHIHDQDLFNWLPDKMLSDELRIYHARQDGEEILAEFSELDPVYKGHFRDGYSMLLAYTIELIQGRSWSDA